MVACYQNSQRTRSVPITELPEYPRLSFGGFPHPGTILGPCSLKDRWLWLLYSALWWTWAVLQLSQVGSLG